MPARAEAEFGLHLHNWLESHVLPREAEALIGAEAPRDAMGSRNQQRDRNELSAELWSRERRDQSLRGIVAAQGGDANVVERRPERGVFPVRAVEFEGCLSADGHKLPGLGRPPHVASSLAGRVEGELPLHACWRSLPAA